MMMKKQNLILSIKMLVDSITLSDDKAAYIGGDHILIVADRTHIDGVFRYSIAIGGCVIDDSSIAGSVITLSDPTGQRLGEIIIQNKGQSYTGNTTLTHPIVSFMLTKGMIKGVAVDLV